VTDFCGAAELTFNIYGMYSWATAPQYAEASYVVITCMPSKQTAVTAVPQL
jgi:hypothetical protein